MEELERSSRVSAATYASLLKQCIARKALGHGRQIHAHILAAKEKDPRAAPTAPFLGNLLLQLYARCGDLDRARSIFDGLAHRNLFSWTTMMGGYVQRGRFDRALDLYHCLEKREEPSYRSIEPDAFVYTIALAACSSLGDLASGRAIHARCHDRSIRDVILDTAIINMYAKCGCVGEAKIVFDSMRQRDSIAWNAMIAAFAQNGHLREAILLYLEMTAQGLDPSEATFTTAFTLSILLGACASLESLDRGREIHATIIDRGMESDTVLLNSLVRMYSKCGSLLDAMRVFQSALQDRDRGGGGSIDAITWNAIIVASARSSAGNLSIHLFHEMLLHGFDPNGITLTAVLTACGHAGMIESFHSYFALVVGDCRVVPGIEHYECMADLLGRSGRIGDVQELLQAMPFFPNAASWRSLLGACRVHSSGVEIAGVAAGEVAVIEPSDHTAYVMLSNVYTINNS
ncbi:hypothetical protein SELMODRAFT_131534 [Selaginella moellendorffii]|uniref:Pentacotripeptide-repeat region of PRORP domain-containing protein n=1 Tax=Selaginella moellendorffii TaxID=88036 RepID=D8T428_SELML|nr:hypothetical protein SELMODRAFT_131534 [Selaginella moellendorffii]